MSKRPVVRITVKQVAPTEVLDQNDREDNPTGVYEYPFGRSLPDDAATDFALDSFNHMIPIGSLEDFSIQTEVVR